MDRRIDLGWASPRDYPDCLKVWQRVYGVEVFSDDWTEPLEFQRFIIGRVGGRPAFAAVICDYPTLVRGQLLSCAGIAAVGVLPEFRGSGTGQQMMDATMALVREAGYEIASLYAFREPFYRKSGFEACGWRWQIKCPIHQLPQAECDLPVREVESGEVAILADCYRAFIRQFSGSCDRTPAHWARRLGRKPPQIYAVGNPIEGYLWCNPHGFWNDLEIGEMAWNSPRGYESLLNLMRTLGINKTNVIWREPPESGFARRFVDGQVEMERHRPTMFAVVDAESVLVKFGADLSRFSIEFRGSLVGTGSRIQIDEWQLGQAILGSPSLGELVRWGEVSGEEGACNYLQTILSPTAVCCMEFF